MLLVKFTPSWMTNKIICTRVDEFTNELADTVVYDEDDPRPYLPALKADERASWIAACNELSWPVEQA